MLLADLFYVDTRFLKIELSKRICVYAFAFTRVQFKFYDETLMEV